VASSLSALSFFFGIAAFFTYLKPNPNLPPKERKTSPKNTQERKFSLAPKPSPAQIKKK
jgi:hypothetical protein